MLKRRVKEKMKIQEPLKHSSADSPATRAAVLPGLPCPAAAPEVFMFTVLLHVRPIMQMEEDMIPTILPLNGSLERTFIHVFLSVVGAARRRPKILANLPSNINISMHNTNICLLA